jgi:hypothetical protein
VAIPADRNVVQKEAEKKLKYESLCIEIQRMWNLKCTIIPITIGATGNEKLKEKFGSCTRKSFDRFTTKTTILGTSHIIRKVLQCEASSLSGGDHRWFKRTSRKKRPVTRDLHNNNNNNNNNNCLLYAGYLHTHSRDKPCS